MKLVQPPIAGHMQRHPLFMLEARRFAWVGTPQSFRQHSRRILLWMHVAVFAVWLLFMLLDAALSNQGFGDRQVYVNSINMVNWIMLLSIGLGMILDFRCLQVALRSINGEVEAGRWDLLRLTALSEQGIVLAKHAGARLKVWRLTMIIASLRVATISLGLFAVLVVPYLVLGENLVVEGLFTAFLDDPLGLLVVVVIAFLTALVYCIEPFWRAQTMTALGMVLSAWVSNLPLATLAAVGVIFAVWLVQMVILVALFFGLGVGLAALFAPLMFGYASLVTALYFLLSCIITAVTVYGFYTLLQTWALRHVVRRIRRSN